MEGTYAEGGTLPLPLAGAYGVRLQRGRLLLGRRAAYVYEVAFALFLSSVPAPGSEFVWSGWQGDGRFTTPSNWSGTNVPPNDATADIVFQGAPFGVALDPTVDVGVPYSLHSLQHGGDGSTVGYTRRIKLTGEPLALAAGGIINFQDNVNYAQADSWSIDSLLELTEDQTWEASRWRATSLTINGGITGAVVVSVYDPSYERGTFILSGSNTTFSGTIQSSTMNAGFLERYPNKLTLSNPDAMIGGNIDLTPGKPGAVLLLKGRPSSFAPIPVYRFGIGSGPGDVLTGAAAGGIASDRLAAWDPGGGSNYVWKADFGVSRMADLTFMTPGTQLILDGSNRTIGGDGFESGALVIQSSLTTTGTPCNLDIQANVILTAPTTVEGTTTVSRGSMGISDLAHLPTGNLTLDGGTLVLDDISWSDFVAARPYGPGDGQWRLLRGGFSARGTNLVIDSTPPGLSWDTDLTFGAEHRFTPATGNSSSKPYADAQVDLAADFDVTDRRTIFVASPEGGALKPSTVPPKISGSLGGSGGIAVAYPGDRILDRSGELVLGGTNNHWTGASSVAFSYYHFNTGPGGLLVRDRNFVIFDGPASLPTGGMDGSDPEHAFLAALRDEQQTLPSLNFNDHRLVGPGTGYRLPFRDATDARHGFGFMADADGETYEMPPGYKMVIGGSNVSGPASPGMLKAMGAGPVTLRNSAVVLHEALGLFLQAEDTLVLGETSTPLVFQSSRKGGSYTDSGVTGDASELQDLGAGATTRTITAVDGFIVLENVAYRTLDGVTNTTSQYRWHIGDIYPLYSEDLSTVLAADNWQVATIRIGNGFRLGGRPVVRETGGTASGSTNSLNGMYFRFYGGVLETHGLFNRRLGPVTRGTGYFEFADFGSVNEVGVFGFGGGGWAAHGDDLTVDLNDPGPDLLEPNHGYFLVKDNSTPHGYQPLLFGSRTANARTTFVDDFNLTNEVLLIEATDNPESTNDWVELTGNILGGKDLYIEGDGFVVLAGDTEHTGATRVRAKLVVNGRHDRGGVLIEDGGTLFGTGTISTLVLDEGAVAPGDPVVGSPMTQFTATTLTVQGSGSTEWVFNLRDVQGTTPGEDWDVLTLATYALFYDFDASYVSNTIRLISRNPANGGPGNANFNARQAFSIKLIESGSGIYLATAKTINEYFDIDTSDFGPDLAGGQFLLDLVGNDIYLRFTPAEAEVRITGITKIGPEMVLEWRSDWTDHVYAVEACTNLLAPDWRLVGPTSQWWTSELVWTNTAPLNPNSFFRLQSGSP